MADSFPRQVEELTETVFGDLHGRQVGLLDISKEHRRRLTRLEIVTILIGTTTAVNIMATILLIFKVIELIG